MAWHRNSGVNKPGSVSKKFAIFRHGRSNSSSPTLGILAFETAKTMTRLVALFKSLSDDEFYKLRQGPIKSPGVAVLNSADETYLLGLACREKLEDLNKAAAVVSRLGNKCIDLEHNRFEFVYRNIIVKQGNINDSNRNNNDFKSRNVGKIIEKMEKFANSTSLLYSSMLALDELEMSEKKMQKLKRNADQKAAANNIDYYNEKITFQRKQVRHYRQISLWSETFDTSVELMARIISVIYTRICSVFGPFVPTLPRNNTKNCRNNLNNRRNNNNNNLYISKPKTLQKKVYPETTNCNSPLAINNEKQSKKQSSKSGPIMKTSMNIKPISTVRFHSSELSPKPVSKTISTIDQGIAKKGLLQSGPKNSVGEAGLAIRYANVIIMAENYFYSNTTISEEAREYMFEMLPMSLKNTLRGKLKSHWCKDAEEREGQQGLAEGWKEALEDIIGWLAPVAHDTLRWQQERNLEQQKLDSKPTVLLLQTLHFSDLELTEAAIVDVLVGLSCIYRYENRRESTGCYRNWL